MNWYVLFVVGNEEEKIKSFLNRKYNDWEAFFPMVKKLHRMKGNDVIRLKPMFPNYIFVKSNINFIEFKSRLSEIRKQKSGIIKQLEYDHDQVSALRKEEIEYLERLLDDEFFVVPSKGYIKDGHVVITEGPLVGLESNIKKINKHNRSALVSFNILDEIKSVSLSLIIEK